MSYATQAEVLTEFKDFVPTSSTAISTTDIDAMIAEAEAEINSRLCVKYTTPITGTEALLIARMVEKWLVKFRIEYILQVKTGREPDKQEGGKSLRQMALDILDALVKGTMKLSDATLASSADGVKSYSSANDTQHVFDKSAKQW